MKGQRINYLPEELDWIEARKEWDRKQLHSAFCFMFDRTDVSLKNLNALCKRKGWLTGRTGCFVKGHTPPNKGRKGFAPPGSEKGWFKRGGEPHNTKYLGYERLSKDGYVEISVDETNPHTGYGRRFVHKHRWLWEQVNGPVPQGHALKCLDGNRLNTDPSNWVAIPRGMLPRLNGKNRRDYDTAPAEVKPTIMAIARLEQRVHDIKKGKTPCPASPLPLR